MASVSFVSTAKLSELLSEADPHRSFSIRVLSANRLALGVDPLRPTMIIDLSKEIVAPFDGIKPESAPPAAKVPTNVAQAMVRGTRKSGEYYLEFNGQTVECKSLKELLAEGLRALESHKVGTLEQLSNIGHSKRIVSRDPKKLFGKEHLVEKYSAKLFNGWWYGTNNSAPETKSWLQKGCRLAGLRWGTDFNTSL